MAGTTKPDSRQADGLRRSRVILVDDSENVLRVISRELRDMGCECTDEKSPAIALRLLGEEGFDVALVDLEMPEIDGFQMLAAMKQRHPEVVPIILTGRGDIPRVVKAMKLGAFDFLEKPCNPHLLETAIERALEFRRLRWHARQLESEAVETRSQLERERASSQSSKLESVGRLAAGIAHEINTPTQYVGDNIEFLRGAYQSLAPLLALLRRMAESRDDSAAATAVLDEIWSLFDDADTGYLLDQIPRAIDQALEGIERISSIVQAMKEFSHPGSAGMTSTDLNRSIDCTITVSRNEWKYVADVEADLDPELPYVCCMPGDLNQVFLNLIVNAAHAIGDRPRDTPTTKGKITVSTRRDGNWAEVRISDTGHGIPESIRDRVFEPFFTTKEVGRGTGQGLAIARSVIVDKHGGTIDFDSESGVGTTFTIRLPIDMGEQKR